jgi:hypothetical protein
MQALTGLWAQQFGTLNWAAHGGLCSVNMAAAAGVARSTSSNRARRTSGSYGTPGGGGLSVAITGWCLRTSRGLPQVGPRSAHSGSTMSAGPNNDEQWRRHRSSLVAKATSASASHPTGTRLADAQHNACRPEPSE